MKTQDLYEKLENLEASQAQQVEKLQSLREQIGKVIEQNSELTIENSHLRTRLQELEGMKKPTETQGSGLSKSRQNLEKLYEQGFHVCTYMYGSRRENNEPCAFCLDVIYGQHQL